jgi:uncharacterized protein (DUF58 family)
MRHRLNAPALRLPALLLLASLLTGAGVLYLGLSFHGGREVKFDQALKSEASASRSAREANAKLHEDRRQAELHRRIQHSGFLGKEDRAGWVTALGQARSSLKLNSLSWRLSPRSASNVMPGLWVSAMDITADSLDTPGLEALLDHLRVNAPGRFTVDHCALTFNPDKLSGQAECRLLWWTWDDPTQH